LVDVFVPVWVCIRTSHARYRQNTCQNTCQYVLVCIEYIPIPPLRIGHVLMHVFSMYSHVLIIGTCLYIPNTQAIRAKYVSIQTGMYQYIPGMYQYMPSIRTKIHTKIHTNTERWYWYVSVRIKFQYVHYTSLMKT